MLHVDLDHILQEEEALNRIQDILNQVERSGEIYLLTKNGSPAVALMSIDQLEQLMPSQSTPAQPVAPAPEFAAAMPDYAAIPAMPTPEPAPIAPSFNFGAPAPLTEAPAAAVAAPVAEPTAPEPTPAPNQNIPPISGSLNLPDMPQDDLSNSSPLA